MPILELEREIPSNFSKGDSVRASRKYSWRVYGCDSLCGKYLLEREYGLRGVLSRGRFHRVRLGLAFHDDFEQSTTKS